MSHRTSKRRAIQNALSQLGWQAKSKDVIALLADYNIEVSGGLVNKVRIDSLKKSDESKMKQAKLSQMARERRTKGVIKLPQRRTYWR
jgi:hypothetical protein